MAGKTIYVCPSCYAIADDYSIADSYNSTKFSRCCQSALDKYENCDDDFIECIKIRHQEFVRRNKTA